MTTRKLSIIAGFSYLIIFFTAIYANFFVLDAVTKDPVNFVTNNSVHIRLGALAFLIAAVFDVVVAWALSEIYKNHNLTPLSTYFRIIHATIMGVAVFALVSVIPLTTKEDVLTQIGLYNTIWLIGLFFFGIHLILLGRITKQIKIIPAILVLAGTMYIIDTGAHFFLQNYESYADIFLMLVAIPAVFGEMAFTIWLLLKGGKSSHSD